jgi:hypothetical protein
MDEQIDAALQTIEDDYKICLRIIGRYFDYLETCGLKEFNKYSKYKWSYDRDRRKGGSYVCIRYGNSLIKKCLVKKRAYIENDELYKWVKNKDLVQEALDEAYQYIAGKISGVKGKIDDMKRTAEEYAEKLENISGDNDSEKEEEKEEKTASKKISWET